MTATITKPATLNSAANDYVSPNGVRVSAVLYLDPPITPFRKAWLNAVRDAINNSVESTPVTQSGISVVTNTGNMSKVETFLGMTFDNLRGSLFTRGGISADLVLKLQELTGIVAISPKEIQEGIKAKASLVTSYVKENTFN
jgi:hypothetical protein